MLDKKFFVYGTLKAGECRDGVFERVLGHNDFKRTTAKTFGKLYNLGEFPGMTVGTDRIYGEVVSLSEKDYYKMLPVLDMIEGFDENNPNSLYARQEVEVTTPEGDVQATTYFFNDKTILNGYGKYIESGEWNTREENI